MTKIITITSILKREKNKMRQYALAQGWDGETPLLKYLELHFNAVIKARIIDHESFRQNENIESKKLQVQIDEGAKAQAALVDLEAELIADIVIDAREEEV